MGLNTPHRKVRWHEVTKLAVTDEALHEVLSGNAAHFDLRYLLAHHDDGVVWGKWDGKGWSFAATHFSEQDFPSFRAQTLQQCRAFGPSAELLIWRDGAELKGKVLEEVDANAETGEEAESFDLDYLLWGNQVEATNEGFAVLCEGKQGLRHAPPVELVPSTGRGALRVRHYIGYSEHQAQVRWTRLVALKQEGASNAP